MNPLASPLRRILRAATLILLSMAPLSLPAAWNLVWSDEFTQPDNTAPDPSKWGYDVGGWGWGNNEEQYYTTSLDNARIENNQLVIEVRDDTGTNGNPDIYFGNDYTSARLLTKGKFDQLYGKFEARIKVPAGGSGLWPAFWMLGADFPNVRNWPFCGEIDIMEYVSRIPNEVFGTIHGPGYSGGASFGNTINLGQPVANNYHVFTVEWEPDEIRWYLNGIQYHTAVPADVAPNEWVFNESVPPEPTDGFFMILNVAIGGDFGGFIDAGNITFPTRMLVDYVRVYEQVPDNAELQLTKTPTFNDENGDGFADPGETIDYAFTIENSGNVPLTDISVTSPDLSVTGAPAAPPNLLTNEGFEADLSGASPTGWSLNLSGGSSSVSSAYANSGSNSLVIDSNGAGAWTSPNVFQSFPASPGDEFNLQGYMFTPTGITSSAFGLLKIEFTDGTTILEPDSISIGTGAGGPFFGGESTPFLSSASTAGQWIFTETQAVAPAGTTTVNFYALNVNPPGNFAVMYFDDILATNVSAGDPPINLLAGEVNSTTFTATHTITQADIIAGQFLSMVTASSSEGVSDNDQEPTPLIEDPEGDFDNDGILNIFERAFVLDLFSPDPVSAMPSGSTYEDGGQVYMTFSYGRQNIAIVGDSNGTYTSPDFIYTVEVSDDMTNWSSNVPELEIIFSFNSGVSELVSIRSTDPIVPGVTKFMRLRVEPRP